mmetsp:Transcript_11922/g.27635  ORF Transcript_11922/g.27635 Transcript_11922/m.27635 type:complete len:503 (+) Transcript_11922:845-2353(+)
MMVFFPVFFLLLLQVGRSRLVISTGARCRRDRVRLVVVVARSLPVVGHRRSLLVGGSHGDALDDAFDGPSLEGNLVDDLDEGKVVDHVLRRDELVGVSRRDGALEFLSVEKVGLDFVPESPDVLVRLLLLVVVVLVVVTIAVASPGPGKGLRALAVPSAVAGGDEVGHPTGFRKGVVSDPIEEHVAELGHLPESHPQERRLGVPPEAYAVDESGAEGYDVLEGPADLGTRHVRDVLDAKVGRAVEEEPRHLVGRGAKVRGEGRLAHLALGDLGGDVGSHENAAGKVVAHGLGDSPGNENGRSRLFAKVDPLDETDSPAGRMGGLPDRRKQPRKKLVGKDEDEEGRVPAGFRQVRHGADVLRELDSRKVLDVLVFLVDDLRQFAIGSSAERHRLFEDPHVDPRFVKGKGLAVLSDDRRYRGSPVSAPDDADLVELIGAVLGVRAEGVVHWICCRRHLVDNRTSSSSSSAGGCLLGVVAFVDVVIVVVVAIRRRTRIRGCGCEE